MLYLLVIEKIDVFYLIGFGFLIDNLTVTDYCLLEVKVCKSYLLTQPMLCINFI